MVLSFLYKYLGKKVEGERELCIVSQQYDSRQT